MARRLEKWPICATLTRLLESIRLKLPGKLSDGVILLHDIARQWRTGQVASLPDGKWAPLYIRQFGPPDMCRLKILKTILRNSLSEENLEFLYVAMKMNF
ncbi:hypothetical protein AVEN_137478-1 [Araneus ventricosus]|uniref:Uncharacterized protein n=1 Tax=Araneus ventricosus TaxID=182803 RepID=A0A4Y2R228_ARAVE|nr:hypothetical protein AVEN_137478-1 [Araneus ventricosus]